MKLQPRRSVYWAWGLMTFAEAGLVASALAGPSIREYDLKVARERFFSSAGPTDDEQVIPSLYTALRLAQSERPQKVAAEAVERNRKPYGLEEIIVTATKRTGRLQDVPISITAITEAEIDRRGLVDGSDYLRGMPGANQIEAAPSQSIVIRGLETQHAGQGLANGQTTGTYFGESPTTGSAGALSSSVDIKLIDIERVEVLRGPQGTTFGSASLGGVVRIIPVGPKLDRFEGKMSIGYSATSGTGGDNYNVQAVGNIPLVRDKFAVRATGYQYQDSGFYQNRARSNATFQSSVVIPQGAEAFATDNNEVGSYGVVGGRITALWQATDDLKLTASYLAQKTETDGIPVAMIGPYEQTVLAVAPEHVRRGQTLGLIDTDLDLANAVLEYDLRWADLLVSYSYVEGETVYMRPISSVGLLQARSQANEAPHHGRIGEIRIATKLEGAWNFLAGAYIESSDDHYEHESVWFGEPSPFVTLGRDLGGQVAQIEQKQKAAFGEVSLAFLPRWTVSGGIRFSDYEVSNQIVGTGLFLGADSTGRTEDSKTTPKVGLNYKPSDNALLYTGYSEGFRVGRPVLGPGPPASECDLDGDGTYDGTQIRVGSLTNRDSDNVDSYEIGGKFSLMDGRLRADAAVFRMDWTGIPVTAVLPCNVSYSVSAGKARSEGVELQVNFQITDSTRLDFGGSWIDAQLTKDAPLQGWSSGDNLPGTPDVNANIGLQYEFTISNHKAFLRGDSIYVGPFHSLIGQELEAGDYVKLDVTARVEIGNFDIDLFARNLTNEDAFTYHSTFALPGLSEFFGYQLRPRTVGLQVGYAF